MARYRVLLRTLTFMAAVVLVGLTVAGCSSMFAESGPAHPLDPSGEIVVALADYQPGTGWTAELLFSQGRHSFVQTAPADGTSFEAAFEIPVGTWDVQLTLLDEDGEARFQDTITDVVIYPEHQAAVAFQLRPADGTVQVVVDLQHYHSQDEVLRVRVHFDDTVEELTRDTPDEPLVQEYALAPGTYDFRIELFTGSFRATDRIHAGLWETLAVEPSTAMTVVWEPAHEMMHMEAEILLVPEAPVWLDAELADDALSLSWTHPEADDLSGYYLYAQWNVFEQAKPLVTADETMIWEGTTAQYALSSAELESLYAAPLPALQVGVAPVSEYGILGYRAVKTVTLD